MKRDNRVCLICRPKNRTIYFHVDEKTGLPWLWCNKCNRGYSLQQYCEIADISIEQLMADGGIEVSDSNNTEINAMAWPSRFVPLSDPRAEAGVEYVKSRGLNLDGDMYYDLDNNGIVFPYYYDNHFCGAQVRFIEERVNEDGSSWKITTLPGTKLGLLFYGWNQSKLFPQVKGIIVTEGAFNALALQQALVSAYSNISNCPWRVFALSGSGVSTHQAEVLRELKEKGYKVVAAPDTDEAGIKMYQKLYEADAITHYAFSDVGLDWNDQLKARGFKDLAKYFISCITMAHVDKK